MTPLHVIGLANATWALCGAPRPARQKPADVGPFIFFDHLGPTQFAPGSASTCGRTPHWLATVTYLFAGSLEHRDSLGTVREIGRATSNWMSAEAASPIPSGLPGLHAWTASSCRIQSWVALPTAWRTGADPSSTIRRMLCPPTRRPGWN